MAEIARLVKLLAGNKISIHKMYVLNGAYAVSVICFSVFLRVVQAIPDQKDEGDVHSTGRTANKSCLEEPTSSKTVNWNEHNQRICCDCPQNSTIIWYDEDCMTIGRNGNFLLRNKSIDIFAENNSNRELILYCTDSQNCSHIITVRASTETVVINEIPPGIHIFIAILVVLLVLMMSCCLYRKRKNHIYLCCRDMCRPSKANDGKEYDAYISVGKSPNDMKFIQRNIVDVLQRMYNYKFYIDDENLLPQLEFSEKVQTKLQKCRRLVVMFTPAYMANDWCMYCFSEGLRKLLELNIKMIFVISDVTIQREIQSLSSIVGHVPKVFVSFLPKPKTKLEKDETIQKIRLVLSPPCRSSTLRRGMRAPMLSEVEEIDERSLYENESSKDTKMSTLDNTSTNEESEREKLREEAEYGFEDPNSIKVHQYKAKKNFYSITAIPKE